SCERQRVVLSRLPPQSCKHLRGRNWFSWPEPRVPPAVESLVATRIRFLLTTFLAITTRAIAADTSMLELAVENWLGERDHWAFTQRAVEYESGKPRERLERYDPSKP